MIESCFNSEQKARLNSTMEGCHWPLAICAMAEVFLLLAFSKCIHYFFNRLVSYAITCLKKVLKGNVMNLETSILHIS